MTMPVEYEQFVNGRRYWKEFLNMYGHETKPTEERLWQVAKKLNVRYPDFRECVVVYLSA